MSIISVKQQITKFFIPDILNPQAKSTDFMKRIRAIKPLELITSIVAALSKSNVKSINEILNPTIIRAYNGKGKEFKRPVGKILKEVSQKQNSQKIMDFDVEWWSYKCRLIRCWVASEEKFMI